ncbi:MAG: hypothetical protein WAM14_19635 [Candidatus Nitrosopolaris sp.]
MHCGFTLAYGLTYRWHAIDAKNQEAPYLLTQPSGLGLSFRVTSRALQPFAERSHVPVWEWVQRFDPKQVYPCKRIAAFLIDETQLRIHSMVVLGTLKHVVL